MENPTTAIKNQERAEKKAAKAKKKAEEEAAAAAHENALKELKYAKLSHKVDTLLEKVHEFFPEAKRSQDSATGQTNGVKIFIYRETIFFITFFYVENKLNVVFTFDKEAAADDVSSFLTKLKSAGALFMTKKDLETGVIFAVTVKEVLKFFHTIDNSIAVIHELIAPPRSIAAPVNYVLVKPVNLTKEPSPAEASARPPWMPVVAQAQAPALTSAPVEVTPAQSANQTSSTEENLDELAKQLSDIQAKYEATKNMLIAKKKQQLELAQSAVQALQKELDNLIES